MPPQQKLCVPASVQGLVEFPHCRVVRCCPCWKCTSTPLLYHCKHGLKVLCIACVGTVQFVSGPDGKPIEAILYGTAAQATFQNTAGQVVVVTNNSPGTVTIPIKANGDPSIPAGSNLSVVSTNPSIPNSPTSSSPGGCAKPKWSRLAMLMDKNTLCLVCTLCISSPPLSPRASLPNPSPFLLPGEGFTLFTAC